MSDPHPSLPKSAAKLDSNLRRLLQTLSKPFDEHFTNPDSHFYFDSVRVIEFIKVVAIDLEKKAEELGEHYGCYALFSILGDIDRAKRHFFLAFHQLSGMDVEIDARDVREFLECVGSRLSREERQRLLEILTEKHGNMSSEEIVSQFFDAKK
ncbi:MAG: hypothetical protein KDE03_17275 [Rhodobacteraceae bacterium]|nr:hypothetical protein [Paracoccaceae bacterium]